MSATLDRPRRRDYRAALRKIHAQLNGVQWTPTTTQTIAEIVASLGEGWEIRPPAPFHCPQCDGRPS